METKNHIKLLFFATIRDRAGTRSLEMDIPDDMTIQQLKQKLGADYPNLKESMKSVLITIDREYAFDEAIIPSNAEIALFPPVSGG
ncbi:MAG: molybdopterin converting factor subunit 1 [Anaerolineales bacterium]|nr:molybdopterin converting factor subunit 1 [Anaerolineales bacterium]